MADSGLESSGYGSESTRPSDIASHWLCRGRTNDLIKTLGWEMRQEMGLHPALSESGWRRALELWGFTAIPFFSAFEDPDWRP